MGLLFNESKLECEARYDVTERVSKNYVDIFGINNNDSFTHPGLINMDRRFTLPRRIDYCFATPDLARQVKHCRVIQDNQSDQASDHYPIFIEFDLGQQSNEEK